MATFGNYFGELMVIIISILVGMIGVELIIKLVFKELSKFKKEQNEPYEKSLNKMLDTFTNGFEAIFTAMGESLKPKDEKEHSWEPDLSDWDKDLKG